MGKKRSRSREDILAKRQSTLVAFCHHTDLRRGADAGEVAAGDHECAVCHKMVHVESMEETQARRRRVAHISGVVNILYREGFRF